MSQVMGGPVDCHTEWRKSEREEQMSHNAYIWNLEKCYQRFCFQGRNRHRLRDTKGESQGGRNRETDIDRQTLLILCI